MLKGAKRCYDITHVLTTLCSVSRFLSQGDSLSSIAIGFCIGHSTICEYIKPVCEAIWKNLKPLVFPKHDTDFWRYQAKGFDERSHFPHCVGAVDGKHIHIQAPPNSGTYFYNYKKGFSVVLMAVAGFDCRFTYINVGAYGHQGDSQIFNDSAFYHKLHNNELNFPEPETLPNDDEGEKIPYFIIGDEAFRHMENLQKGYPNRGLNEEQRIYNYRLSSARRCVENAFGILTQRWELYKKPIALSPDKVDACVRATVALHNWLTKPNDAITAAVLQENRAFTPPRGMSDLAPTQHRNATVRAKHIRDYMAHYCMNKGSVHWQRSRAYCNDQ